MNKRKYQIVAEMMCNGYSRRAIAEHLGIRVTNVHNHIKYAKSIGITTRFDRNKVLMGTAPPHIEQWLRKQTPEGASAGDVILAILNDAYNEDMDDESKQTKNA